MKCNLINGSKGTQNFSKNFLMPLDRNYGLFQIVFLRFSNIYRKKGRLIWYRENLDNHI